MRILAISELYPWPATDGYRQRLHHMLAGLSAVGTVDLLCLERTGDSNLAQPPLENMGRVVPVPSGDPIVSKQFMADWTKGNVPRRLLTLDWAAVRAELKSWEPEPDLVWFSHVDSWYPTHDLLAGKLAICDFDNLENLAMKLRRKMPLRVGPGSAVGDQVKEGLRWAGSRSLDSVDVRRWDDVQKRCADDVDRVVVCSPLDVDRAGVDNAIAIPNGANPPKNPNADRTHLRGDTPTMMFVGALDYEPNTEAVEWFVREVWPLIRQRRPNAVFRVIGRGSEGVAWVAEEPGVELVGAVDEIRPELDRADISVGPIRVGAGTRLKVVEAMAHHIPIVTTAVGCEGIEVVDGTHALIADTSRRFADSCLRLMSEPSLRQELSKNAADLFERSYMWTAISRRVGELAKSVLGTADRAV